MRPSPTYKAKLYPNQIHTGNDGNQWQSVANKNGVFAWRKQSLSPVKKEQKINREIIATDQEKGLTVNVLKKPIKNIRVKRTYKRRVFLDGFSVKESTQISQELQLQNIEIVKLSYWSDGVDYIILPNDTILAPKRASFRKLRKGGKILHLDEFKKIMLDFPIRVKLWHTINTEKNQKIIQEESDFPIEFWPTGVDYFIIPDEEAYETDEKELGVVIHISKFLRFAA
jgi:hypothetical protein